MCGHGLIGVVRTLAYLAACQPGHVELDTAVGPVSATLDAMARSRSAMCRAHSTPPMSALDVPGVGTVTGDVAWGGNWFFLTERPTCRSSSHTPRRTACDVTTAIRDALDCAGITGATAS